MNLLSQSLTLAKANLGGSVIRLNPRAAQEAAGKDAQPITFGIKNTDSIPAEWIDRLRNHPKFLWLTIDKMADLGRSIDTDLINPITYRLMSGSTSGGCVNILKGINRICLGTDGGGSVLAPALSTNLYSFMGKGCGLEIMQAGRSTDGLNFNPGLGIISATFEELTEACAVLCQELAQTDLQDTVKIVIPAPGCLGLPGGGDSNAVLKTVTEQLPQRYILNEYNFSNPYNRPQTVEEICALFSGSDTDLILTYEGPVDVFGYDETIPRDFTGAAVKEVTGQSGKALVKAANIAGCSAITIPSRDLASGCVIICRPGCKAAAAGFALAEDLQQKLCRSPLFEDYFIVRKKYVEPNQYE